MNGIYCGQCALYCKRYEYNSVMLWRSVPNGHLFQGVQALMLFKIHVSIGYRATFKNIWMVISGVWLLLHVILLSYLQWWIFTWTLTLSTDPHLSSIAYIGSYNDPLQWYYHIMIFLTGKSKEFLCRWKRCDLWWIQAERWCTPRTFSAYSLEQHNFTLGDFGNWSSNKKR